MIPEFLTYLRSVRGYSPNTVRSYEKDLRSFSLWASYNYPGISWSKVTRDIIDKYIIYLDEQGKKPTTSNRKISAISSLYMYFQRQGYGVANPCKFESRKKIAQKVPNTIPMAILQQAHYNSKGQLKALIGILITTGMRIQEALDLTCGDIDFKEGRIKIHGKGLKERVVYVDAYTLEKDLLWLKKTNPETHIFNYTQRQARYEIYTALKPLTNSPQLSPHAIRHTIATIMANNGENATTIAKVLGHNRLETSQKYIDFSQVEKATTGITL